MFALATLIPDVLETLRAHLREGVAGQIAGIDAIPFLVRQGTGDGDPDVTAPAAVIFPDDLDPGVPIVRLTMDSIELPDEAFEDGDEILVEWRVIADCLAATANGARTADISADSAEARLASATFNLLAPSAAFVALEELGIEGLRPKIDGLISRDKVFRYPISLTFSTLVTV